MNEVGSCIAIINKIQTLQDGGARITFDIPETEITVIQNLLQIKFRGQRSVVLGIIEGDQDGQQI